MSRAEVKMLRDRVALEYRESLNLRLYNLEDLTGEICDALDVLLSLLPADEETTT